VLCACWYERLEGTPGGRSVGAAALACGVETRGATGVATAAADAGDAKERPEGAAWSWEMEGPAAWLGA
jgi:hypothetical protein